MRFLLFVLVFLVGCVKEPPIETVSEYRVPMRCINGVAYFKLKASTYEVYTTLFKSDGKVVNCKVLPLK